MAEEDRTSSPPEAPDETLPQVPGYHFRDPALLRRALTHCSHGEDHNERLEFLGDAVISTVVAEVLFRETTREVREGCLSLARARVVSREALARVALSLGLDDYLRLGTGEERTGGARKDRILCGALEALVGAVFLDGGYEAARAVTVAVLGDCGTGDLEEDAAKDPRNLLQEAAQAHGLELPDYSVISEEGKPHDRLYEVQVTVGKVSSRGSGASKKAASRAAAAAALVQIERFPFVLEEAARELQQRQGADDEDEGGGPV